MSDRFYVVGVTGYSAGPGVSAQSSSYSVLDSAYSHREVFTQYVIHGRHQRRMRIKCEHEARRLNEWEDEQT